MTTLAEIENAVDMLSREQKYALYRYLVRQLGELAAQTPPASVHSVLDIAPVHLGPVLRPFDGDHDLLDEMLEERT